MDKFILTIEASVNAAGGGSPVLDIIVDGIPVTSSAAITSITGVGSDLLVFTLDFTGGFPTSLAFRFNGGSGDPGDVVSLDSVRINGHALAPADLTGILIAQGATQSVVSTAAQDHLFGRVEAVLADLGTVTVNGTGGDDDLQGGSGADVIDGDAGNDRILAFDDETRSTAATATIRCSARTATTSSSAASATTACRATRAMTCSTAAMTTTCCWARTATTFSPAATAMTT